MKMEQQEGRTIRGDVREANVIMWWAARRVVGYIYRVATTSKETLHLVFLVFSSIEDIDSV